jgi:GT2 family glycosyltransferase
MNITISLVSLNQLHDLARLIPSLLPAASLAEAEVLLVANRCTDGTQGFVRHNYPAINTFANPQTAGYGENHNLNLQRASGRYFVIMNSDMTVELGSLVFLRDFMDRNPDVGIACPTILNEDGTIQSLNRRFPTVLDLTLRRFLPGSLKPLFRHRLQYYEMRADIQAETCDIQVVSGSFMFCRTDVLRSVGGFDSRYFMYFEDVDLSRRVQRTHRTVHCSHVSVTHFWQRSAHRKRTHARYFVESAFRYFNQWGYRLF